MTEEPDSLQSPFGEKVWEVLARYLSNESPPEEAAAVRRWLAEDRRGNQLVGALERSLHGLAFRAPADLDVEAAWRRVSARARQPDVRALQRKRWLVTGLRAAAAVAIVLGATVLWRRARIDSGGPAAVIESRTYVTPVGKTDSIRLPDGSRVVLGPGSRLTLAASFGRTRRDARLVGQALFDVVHDPSRPFAVRAGRAVIQDLGTIFAVRDDGGLVQVVVTSGSVMLQDSLRLLAAPPEPGQGLVLRAGDRGTLGPQGEAAVEPAAVTEDDLAWTTGRLVFNHAPLPSVAAELRRWYGIDLRIPDAKLADRHLTASFAGEPVSEVLRIIGLALGAELERRGDTAWVRSR